MPRYNEVYISQQDFEISLHNGMRYDGFVEGMGYAYTSHFSIPPLHFQKHNPPGRVSNDQGFFQNGFVQYIDSSPQMRLMSVKYVHKVKSGDTLTSIAQQYGVSIQAVKDANSNINWAGERKGDRILAGEELKLPNEVKEDFADSSKSKGARSGNPLIGPTVARANFEQRLSKSLYGGGVAANGAGGLASSKWFKQGADWGEALLRMHNNMPADAYSVAGNIDIVGLLGADMSFPGRLWIASGNDRGKSTNVFDFGVAAGLDVGASVVMTSYYFVGDTNQLKIGDFEGSRWSLSLGLSFIVELGGGFMVAPVPGKGYIIGKSQHIGVSPPGPSGNINWGRTGFY